MGIFSNKFRRNLYPWGDTDPKKICNINNVNNYCTSVELYESGNNIRNISQLIGNVWEWWKKKYIHIIIYNGLYI